jgi:hypothetical protein
MPELEALNRLVEDGYLRREDGRLRTTPRWQAAMARSAIALQAAGAPWNDLRLPIAGALAEHYASLTDNELADLVEVMLPVEEAELEPLRAPTGELGQ